MKRARKRNMPDVDESTLIYAVLHGKDTSARCAALKKIVNVEPIVDDLMHDEDPLVRFALIEKIGIGEADTLAKIALLDEDRHVRCAALAKIKDIELLIDIALHDKDDEVRSVAAERYEQIDKHDRSRAVERACDVKALVYIASRDKDAFIRERAVKKIDDAKALIEVALHDRNRNVRCVAVRRIHQVSGAEALVNVMQQSDDSHIRKLARKLVAEYGFAV